MTVPTDLQEELSEAWADLEKAQKRLKEVRRRVPSEPVQDYELSGPDGVIKLSEIFGDKTDLILIHNMGSGCPYCTMWADGFNGVLHHLEDRSAFVVVSPDSVETQQKFRRKRGWRFRMLSAGGTTLFKDMGFESEDEHYGSNAMPGVSVFHKSDRRIDRARRLRLPRTRRLLLQRLEPLRPAARRRRRLGSKVRLFDLSARPPRPLSL